MESVLKIENLKCKNILKNITFSLKEKSHNILIGPNSSGKTMLVNCIRGLLNYEGNIYLFNQNIKEKNIYNEVGFFIEDEIFLENTVFEELISLLTNLDFDKEKAKKKIYSIVKKLDIVEILFKQEKDLLNYEKMLVNFIFSVIHDPKLLIIDSDLENLDEKNKNKIFEYLKSQKKLTTLFITTDSRYFSAADNLLFLKDGEIILSGTFDEVIKEEKAFIKCGSNFPFNVDLSNKLISYELLNSIEVDTKKMVNEIWK